MTAQLALYAVGGVFVLAGAIVAYRDWRKKPPKVVKLTPSTITDDIPDLIAAAKLMQSVGSQAGVNAAMDVVAMRLHVGETITFKVPVAAATSGGETSAKVQP